MACIRGARPIQVARRPAPCDMDPAHGHGDGCACGHMHPGVPHLEYVGMDDGHPDTRQYFEELHRREAAEDRERVGLAPLDDTDTDDDDDEEEEVDSSPGVSDADDDDEIDMSGELMFDQPIDPGNIGAEVEGGGERSVAVAALVDRAASSDDEDDGNEDGYLELEADDDAAVTVPLLTVTSNSPARRAKISPAYAAGSPPEQQSIPLSDMSQKRDLLLAARRGSDNLTLGPKRVSP